MKASAVGVLALLVLSMVMSTPLGLYSTAASCAPTVDPFSVVGSTWGSTSAGVGPGDQNVQLNVQMVYSGGCSVNSAQFQLVLKQPFTGQGGATSLSQYEVNLPSYASFQLTYTLNIAQGANVTGYQLPLDISFSTQNYTGFSETTNVPVYLLGSVSLGISSPTQILVPGQVNNVTFELRNIGTGNASHLTLALAQTQQGISLLTQLPNPSSLQAGGTLAFSEEVYVSSSAAGQPLSLPFVIGYTNAYGVPGSVQQSVGFYVQSSSAVVGSTSISVTTVTPQVTIGQSSVISIRVTNTGKFAIHGPTFTLSVPAGFAVTANSSYSNQSTVIMPGGSFVFNANVSSGPKTPEGAYSGTLTLSYTDALGNFQTATFPVGFVAVGTIQLVVQGLSYSNSGNVLTVSGTLLNEGTTSAYYLQVAGTVIRGNTALGQGFGYVGEVDPNTPVPFSFTVTLPALTTNGSAAVSLTAGYLNDYGKQGNATFPLQPFDLALTSAGSGQTGSATSGIAYLALLRITVLAVILIAVVASLAYIVRSRRRRGRRDEASSDEKVI